MRLLTPISSAAKWQKFRPTNLCERMCSQKKTPIICRWLIMSVVLDTEFIAPRIRIQIWYKVKCHLDATRSFYWCILSSTCFGYICPSSGALDVELQPMVSCTEFLDGWWSWEPLRRSCVRCGWCRATSMAPSAPYTRPTQTHRQMEERHTNRSDKANSRYSKFCERA